MYLLVPLFWVGLWCHELWSLITVMQPHTVYSKHKDLLHSCYWKLKVNPTYGSGFAHWTIIFVPVTQHLRGHQLYSKKNAEACFLPWQFKNLANMRQAHQVLWGCVIQWWQLSGMFVLHFMLLWLSFRLWVWQRELNCLNSISYLFIAIYAALFYDKQLSFLAI